tara:strand:+ start:3665 stop:4699 length:1035 start_codon:yes stop_codon:yes gene_type:complete
MNKTDLNKIAKNLCASPKGILAADESTNTIKKRFDSIQIESSFESRRDYRELLFKTKNLSSFISGVILFEETLKQKTSDGISIPDFLLQNGIMPGIKVDRGAINLTSDSEEKVTEGLDGLNERLLEYKSLGSKFTKWRAIININLEKKYPTNYCLEVNAFNLARYAKIVQDSGMVPIVEPEVIMDGNHSIEDCFDVTSLILSKVFDHAKIHDVDISGILLKPNMVISGTTCKDQASIEKVSKMTVECLQKNVPDEVPGIVFLSGGQSNKLATSHLNEMNKLYKNLPWKLSFSYGRALQQPSLKVWEGKKENIIQSQEALYNRSKLNSLATLGDYSSDDEKQIIC